MDRQTDTVLRGRSPSKAMQRVEVQSQQKQACGADCMSKKYGKIDLKHLLQFPDQPKSIFTIQLQENLPKSLAEGFHVRKCTAAGGVNPIKACSEHRLIQFK